MSQLMPPSFGNDPYASPHSPPPLPPASTGQTPLLLGVGSLLLGGGGLASLGCCCLAPVSLIAMPLSLILGVLAIALGRGELARVAAGLAPPQARNNAQLGVYFGIGGLGLCGLFAALMLALFIGGKLQPTTPAGFPPPVIEPSDSEDTLPPLPDLEIPLDPDPKPAPPTP